MLFFHQPHGSEVIVAGKLANFTKTTSMALALIIISACNGNSTSEGELEPSLGRALAEAPSYRINVGGSQISADDGNWQSDQGNSSYRNTGNVYRNSVSVDLTDDSIPAGTPAELFSSERWDDSSAPEMLWKLPVAPGEYEVRLYFAETWSPAFIVGKRVFDVAIEGQTLLDDYDIFADVGAKTAVMKSFTVSTDSSLDIEFLHEAQNPSVKAIEIYSSSDINPPVQPGTDTIEIEAENYTDNAAAGTHRWVVSSLPDASGGSSMVTTPDSGNLKANANGSPMLSYSVNFPDAGTWYVWLRGYGDTDNSGEGKSDSVHVGLNGVLAASADKIDEFPPSWNWSQHTRDNVVATLSVPTVGDHIVNIWMREDGLALDKIVLSNDPTFNPNDPVTPTTNTGPVVNAGIDATFNIEDSVSLNGSVADDGLPNNTLTSTWSKSTGPGSVTFTDALAAATSAVFSQVGTYELTLTGSDTVLSGTDTVIVTITDDTPPIVAEPIVRVNAGGPLVTDSELDWMVNVGRGATGFVNTGVATGYSRVIDVSDSSLPSDVPATIFLTERWDSGANPEMKWTIPIAAGEYEVRLYFAETWSPAFAVGKRVFDVLIEGEVVLDNYDIFADVGSNAGVMKSFAINSDSTLDIDFQHIVQNPSVRGIEIVSLGPVVNQAPLVDAGSNQSTNVASVLILNGSASDDGLPNGQLTSNWTVLSGTGSVEIVDPTNLNTGVTFTTPGSYELQLSVTDDALVTSDVTSITVSTVSASTPDLRIKEFLASNDKGLEDEEGENNDWIEIENFGDTAVNLAGIYLTDDSADLTQWTFPAVTLEPGEFIVVFASGEDRIDAQPLHTNFKLKTGGEYLAIIDLDGTTIIDEITPEYPDQFADISYGLDDDGNYRYFADPTPGEVNSSSGFQGYLEIDFSESRGFYDSPFALELSTGGEATIRYTLNGEEPTANRGTVYTGPISINTTSVVRAYAAKSGYLNPVSMTHTYLFVDDVINQPASISGYPNNQYDLGSGSDTAEHDYEMDPSITQDSAYTADLRQGLEEIPTVSLALNKDELFGGSGFYDQDDLEAPVSMEILYADDPDGSHQVNAGAESHSHKRLKRSMRVNFRSEYGFSSLKSDLLQRAPVNGGSATDKFDRLILRAGNNRAWTRNWNPDDTAFSVDQFYRDTQIAVSGIGSHGTYVHLYINGLYWGMYNIVERPDDNFAEEYLGGDDDDYFFIKHSSAGNGDDARYDRLVDDLINRNLTSASNYALLQEYLDIDKYIDYMLVNFYSAVTDWPGNNFYGGNRNDSSPLGSTPFQYYAWDGEWSWNNQRTGSNPGGRARVHADFGRNDSANSSDPVIQRIWHAVRVNSDFMDRLEARVDELTASGAALSDSVAAERWATINNFIRNAVVAESARWGDALESIDGKTRTRDRDWQDAVDDIAGYINGNSASLKNSLRDNGYY